MTGLSEFVLCTDKYGPPLPRSRSSDHPDALSSWPICGLVGPPWPHLAWSSWPDHIEEVNKTVMKARRFVSPSIRGRSPFSRPNAVSIDSALAWTEE